MSIEVTPGLVDAILAAVALEFALIAALLVHASASRWIAPLFLYLGSGALLLLALRIALSDARAGGIALALLASLVAHAASLLALRRALLRARPRGSTLDTHPAAGSGGTCGATHRS